MPRTKIIKIINVHATSPDATPNPYWDFVIFKPDRPCQVFNVRMDSMMSTDMAINYDLRDEENPKKWNNGSSVRHYLWRSDENEPPVFAENANNEMWLPESLCTERLILYGNYHVDMPGYNNATEKTTGGMNVPEFSSHYIADITGTTIPATEEVEVGDLVTAAHDIPYSEVTVKDIFSGTSTLRDVQSVETDIELNGSTHTLRWMGQYTQNDLTHTGTHMVILFEINLYY